MILTENLSTEVCCCPDGDRVRLTPQSMYASCHPRRCCPGWMTGRVCVGGAVGIVPQSDEAVQFTTDVTSVVSIPASPCEVHMGCTSLPASQRAIHAVQPYTGQSKDLDTKPPQMLGSPMIEPRNYPTPTHSLVKAQPHMILPCLWSTCGFVAQPSYT